MELNDIYTRPLHEAGAEHQVINPVDGELTDFFVTVRGTESKEVGQAFKDEEQKALFARFSKEEFDADASEIRKAVACTICWRGLTEDGKEVKFTEAKAKKLYENAPAVRRQVLNFAGKPANFQPKPSTS